MCDYSRTNIIFVKTTFFCSWFKNKIFAVRIDVLLKPFFFTNLKAEEGRTFSL